MFCGDPANSQLKSVQLRDHGNCPAQSSLITRCSCEDPCYPSRILSL
jgi:hypothetical protein